MLRPVHIEPSRDAACPRVRHGREPAAWKEEKTEGQDGNREEADCGETGPRGGPGDPGQLTKGTGKTGGGDSSDLANCYAILLLIYSVKYDC